MIQRFSSRQANGKLGVNLLGSLLPTAKRYDRIAGFFRSSLLEIAGEAIDAMPGTIRIVCNSDLNPGDVASAQLAQERMRQNWCAGEPQALVDSGGQPARDRFGMLARLLQSGKLVVKVLANEHFGLIHGKAGVVEDAAGKKVCFIGSVNESKSAWSLNYEMVWVDDDPESVAWVQAEFDSLWNDLRCVPLADFVAQDCERLSKRPPPLDVKQWQADPEPAAAFVESPVYRKQCGLWPHQKQFVELAFRLHRRSAAGARLVLADQVGLGKTIQLGMAAALMALHSNLPVLVLAPRTLLRQWQEDLRDLLGVPSAWWNGQLWTDERGIEHPGRGATPIRNCPRQIGIVSTGLATAQTDAAADLLRAKYSCVIVDEAHRARRRDLSEGCERERGTPNNLLEFCAKMALKTHSFLLGTATPIQVHPIELWDLLAALNQGQESVLGRIFHSPWVKEPATALALQTAALKLDGDGSTAWPWLATPLAEAVDNDAFARIRQALGLAEAELHAALDRYRDLPPARQQDVARLGARINEYSPFVRCVVRRTRKQLEQQVDPETGAPRLKPIAVDLRGEGPTESLALPSYLAAAYQAATDFCRLLATRVRGSGFLKTLLLRRVGSSIEAGRLTAEGMLNNWAEAVECDEEDDNDDDPAVLRPEAKSKGVAVKRQPDLTAEERQLLTIFRQELETNREKDPKLAVVKQYLQGEGWLDKGCIIFSQYFASASWLATELSRELPMLPIGLYAGSNKSAVLLNGQRQAKKRDWIKDEVKAGRLTLIIGTDAAAEGLNLQALGTLINLDLPWNPTRLEQRKGRIMRIGQLNDTIRILNLRYSGSVEDQVHKALSDRLKAVHDVFGQIPDVLEDVWVDTALGKKEDAERRITQVQSHQPFELKWNKTEDFDWETCATVIAKPEFEAALAKGW